jgi:prolyl-tRNA synthetase
MGMKTDKEKFAGAERTYTIECMMHDKKALQNGTSHYFGDGFARAFGISFADKNNRQTTPFETSWGITTRTIGGVIMTHGDNRGLVLPPKVAPVQVIVIPVAQHKQGVIEANRAVMERLSKAGFRVKLDDSDNSPGWKFAEYEMKGVPLRLELGPKDMEKNQCVLVRRDSGEKSFVSLDGIEDTVAKMLEDIHAGLYARAKKNLEDNTYPCATLAEVKEKMESQGGFAKTMWCGELECELRMKEEAGVSSRCIPFQQEKLGEVCACCGKPAKHMVYWGVAY